MRVLFAIVTSLTALILGASQAEAFPENSSAPPTLNVSTGNNCAARYYPPQAVRLKEQGSTMLTVHIDETGKPIGVDISTSSGFADLDDAAKSCIIGGWHFNPATQDGKAIASTKQYRIVWKMGPTSFPPRLLAPLGTTCSDIFSDAPNRWASYQSAILEFRVSMNGAVENPFVAISSGDAVYDDKALRCVGRLPYTKPIVDGTPTTYSWSLAVLWSPHTGLAYADGYRLSLFCADSFFPPALWNGNPQQGTIISFHVLQGGVTSSAAVERSSGNSALDQAALQCVREWKMPFTPNLMGASSDFGESVRVDFRDRHAFALLDTRN